jgi:CDP-6-deoxy-D-xylo-4-hexulose-3-dehydrase
MQAALGESQFEHLPAFVQARRSNFEYLSSGLSILDEIRIVEAQPNSDPSWFGFPIVIKKESEVPRSNVIAALTKRNIGTRLIFGGNLVRQPAYQKTHYRQVGNMKNSNLVTENAFWIGLHPGITKQMLDYQI